MSEVYQWLKQKLSAKCTIILNMIGFWLIIVFVEFETIVFVEFENFVEFSR